MGRSQGAWARGEGAVSGGGWEEGEEERGRRRERVGEPGRGAQSRFRQTQRSDGNLTAIGEQ